MGGFNPAAIVALVLAVLPNIPGFLVAAGFLDSAPAIFTSLYTYAWFVGFFLAAVIYLALMMIMGGADRSEAS